MTSCVHKMRERTYGQTNMKRAIILLFTIHVEYILYPHSQSGGYTGIPLSVRSSLSIVYVTSHLSFVGFYSYLVSCEKLCITDYLI
jgi:hypothetical protein